MEALSSSHDMVTPSRSTFAARIAEAPALRMIGQCNAERIS
jgi:hypothetical protein